MHSPQPPTRRQTGRSGRTKDTGLRSTTTPTVSVFTSGTTDFVFVVSAGSVTAIVEGKEKYSISNRAWNMIIVDSYLVIFGSNGVAVYDLFLGVFIWGYSPPQMGLLGVMNQTVVVHTFVYDRHANTVLLFGLDDGFLIQKFENVTGVSGTNDMTPESPYLPVLALDNASQIHPCICWMSHTQSCCGRYLRSPSQISLSTRLRLNSLSHRALLYRSII